MAAVAPEVQESEARRASMASEAMQVATESVRTEQWLVENIEVLSKVNTLNNKSTALRTSRIVGLAESSDQDEGLVAQMNEYLTTVGVVSALILSVALQFNSQALQRSEVIVDEYEISEEALVGCNIVFVVLIFLATLFSGVAIFLSVNLFIDLNTVMVDGEDKLWYIRHSNMQIAEGLMTISLILLAASLPFGLVVVYGLMVCIICSAILAAVVLAIPLWYMRYHKGMRRRMAPSYKFQAEALQRELDALRAAKGKSASGDAAAKH